MNLSSADVDIDYSDRGHKKGDFFCGSSRRYTYLEGYNWNDKYLPYGRQSDWNDKYLPYGRPSEEEKRGVTRPIPLIKF